MQDDELKLTTLEAWLASDSASCELLSDNYLPQSIFVVKTQIGAEHFFARIDCGTHELVYGTVSDLGRDYGLTCPVQPQ